MIDINIDNTFFSVCVDFHNIDTGLCNILRQHINFRITYESQQIKVVEKYMGIVMNFCPKLMNMNFYEI